MSDKERKILNTLKDVACGRYSPQQGTDLILSDYAVESGAPAPQPCEACTGTGYFTVTYEMAADAGQPDRYGAREECRTCGGTPQVTPESAPELELEQEAGGRWIAEFLRFTGVMAYGKSPEEAIRNAAKVLIESEQAAPTLVCGACGRNLVQMTHGLVCENPKCSVVGLVLEEPASPTPDTLPTIEEMSGLVEDFWDYPNSASTPKGNTKD